MCLQGNLLNSKEDKDKSHKARLFNDRHLVNVLFNFKRKGRCNKPIEVRNGVKDQVTPCLTLRGLDNTGFRIIQECETRWMNFLTVFERNHHLVETQKTAGVLPYMYESVEVCDGKDA